MTLYQKHTPTSNLPGLHFLTRYTTTAVNSVGPAARWGAVGK